ncbi:hypothetical protein IGI65_000037 [Enterococcus sp. DIV0755b]|uniref:hypothetical protein n=1 Tax=Enterococcus sp. DIV0755b TaxID=2774657 RepID=UPI003F22BE1D
MINEKIQMMLKELHQECENVGLDALGEQTEKIKPDHTFVVNSAEDIPDILNRIIKGDFQ